jgi:hypothetical protein
MSCIDSNFNIQDGIDYNGQLAATLANMPKYSGVVPGAGQAYTPLSLGPDGQRVVCAAIGMMSGPTSLPNDLDWQRTLLWQAAADISNAISATILKPENTGVMSDAQIALLCGVAKALWSFTDAKPPTAAGSVDVTHGSAPLVSNPVTLDNDFSCLTTAAGCSNAAAQPGWLGEELVDLADNPNNLGKTSATAQVCGWTS